MNKKPHLSGKLKRKGTKKSTIPKPRLPIPPGQIPQNLSSPDKNPDVSDDVSGGGENFEPPISPIVEPLSENEEGSDTEDNSNENDELNNATPQVEENEPNTPPIEAFNEPVTPPIPDEENNNINPIEIPPEESNDNNDNNENITSPIEPPTEENEEEGRREGNEVVVDGNNEIKNEEEIPNNNLNEILPPVDPIVVSQPLQRQIQPQAEGEEKREEEEITIDENNNNNNNNIEPLSSIEPKMNDFSVEPNTTTPSSVNNNNNNNNSVIEKPVDFLPESEYGEGDNYTEPTSQLLFDNDNNSNNENNIYNDNPPPPLRPTLFVENGPIDNNNNNNNESNIEDSIQQNGNNNNNNNFNVLPPLPLDDNFNNFNNNYENIPSSHSPINQQQQQQQQQLPLFVPSMEEDKPLIYEPTTIDQLMQQQLQPQLSPPISPTHNNNYNLNNNNNNNVAVAASKLPPYYPPNSINPIFPQQPSEYPSIIPSPQQQQQIQHPPVTSQFSTPLDERPIPPPQVSNTTTQTSPRLEQQQQQLRQQQQQLRQQQQKQKQEKAIERNVLPLLDPTCLEEVAAYYEKELLCLFKFYASLQSGRRFNNVNGNTLETVNLAEFIKCLKDFDVYTPNTKINRIIVADLFRQLYNPSINNKINSLTFEQFSLCFCKCMAYIISDYPFTIRFQSESELASVMIWLLELDNKIWFKKRCKNFCVFSNGDGDNNGHIFNKYSSPSKIQSSSSSYLSKNPSSNIIQYRLNVLKDNCSEVESKWIDLPTLFPSYNINEMESQISPINRLNNNNNNTKQPHPPISSQNNNNNNNIINSFKSPRTIGYEKRMKVEKMVNESDENNMLLYIQQQQQQQNIQMQQQQQQRQINEMNIRQFKQLEYRIAPTINIAQQAVSRIPYKPPNMYSVNDQQQQQQQQQQLNRNRNNNNNLISWNEINNFSLDNMQNILTMNNNEIDQQQQQQYQLEVENEERNGKNRLIQKYINQNISNSPYNAIKPSGEQIAPFKQSPIQQQQQQQQLPIYEPPSLYKKQQPKQQSKQQQQSIICGNSFSEPPSEIPSGRTIEHSPVIIAKKEIKNENNNNNKMNNKGLKNKKKNNNLGYKRKEKPNGYRDVYKMKNRKVNSEDNNNNNKVGIEKLPIVDIIKEEECPIKVKKSRDIAREMARRAIEVAREQKLKEKGYNI